MAMMPASTWKAAANPCVSAEDSSAPECTAPVVRLVATVIRAAIPIAPPIC